MKGFRVVEDLGKTSEICPYCGNNAEAEWEGYGSCYVQVAPYKCKKCGAFEIGRYDKNENYQFSDKELECGWYKPEEK